MSQFHFQDEEALKAQHISEEEARRVVALWAKEQREQEQRAAQPTVQSLAEGLDIPTDEAVRLLQEVRARAVLEQGQEAALVRRKQNSLGATILIVGIFAFLGAILLFGLMQVRMTNTSEPATVAVEAPLEGHAGPESYIRHADGLEIRQGPGWTYERHADGAVILHTQEGSYERHADGSLRITRPQGSYVKRADGSIEIHGPSGSYIRRADASEEQHGSRPDIPPPPAPPGITLPEVP